MSAPIFEVSNLDVRFSTPDGEVHAVRNANFTIDEGECLGVVGESGSGKSQLFLATIGLLSANGRATGSVKYRSQELLTMKPARLNKLRGSKITMIFQDPLTCLTPHMTVGAQIMEALRTHANISREEAVKRTLEMLELVRIPEAKRRMKQYPHELSGGMRQRVMIAMATACGPDLLIADEPTTALDVTVQAQILEIMRDLKKELKTAIALISHDMGVIAGVADKVQVMRHGDVVEAGPIDDIFYKPKNDYTKMLLDSMPRLDRPDREGHAHVISLTNDRPILDVRDLKVHFNVHTGGWLTPSRPLRAVDGVSFALRQGETLGIVGESGCGKSTLARAVLQLLPKTEGAVVWMSRDLENISQADQRRLRKDLQIVFQDPLASLDPRRTIGESIAEPLRTLQPQLSRDEVKNRVRKAMEQVGLEPGWINRYPHEFSGGQNQRVGIARAMIVEPKLVICDEAVSALDVSIQAQIIDLIVKLQARTGMSLIFISHDLSVVRQISHRVMVLYLGRVMEMADRETIYRDPRHPYTKALISAVPIPDPKLERSKKRVKLSGDLPSPLDTRAQLNFLKSKLVDDPNVEQYRPKLIEVAPGHLVAEHDPV
ncbi:MAG: ABC transporter ATP-binding protein [Alphaproteobacteria bacterium]|nr:ABC transporter ATP-binding protein [Alphaproteobacteria bacterium]MBL6939350.1 ABC transporter ATP-binding protein [Alphaproteobacteria bacterium]MBL7097169.1 ABC transporter ATP-binding protein [Alphaproteobacteria bacterium]